jgi:crotonobetainyl-CoA:carnitine CoA-transferase CaiB-like acyl-CoA transferase
VRYIAPTIRFHGSPASVRSLAPRLGQHTATILAQMGYGEEEIQRLADQKVIRLDRS